MTALFAAEEAAKSDLPVWVGLLLIPILIAINGYFVAAEFALVAVRRTRVEEMVNQGVKGAKRLLAAVTDLDRSVGAAQLGITVASLALGFVSEPALHNLIDLLFDSVQLELSSTVKHVTSVLLTLSLITYMHVVFGEQMPKIAALQSNEKIGLWTAGPLNVFAICTKPVIRLMNGSSSLTSVKSRSNVSSAPIERAARATTTSRGSKPLANSAISRPHELESTRAKWLGEACANSPMVRMPCA